MMRISVAIVTMVLLSSCGGKKWLDLSPYGLPAEIEVPAGVRINAIDLVVMKEINLRKGRFNMQLFIKPWSGDSTKRYISGKYTNILTTVRGECSPSRLNLLPDL
jgi:hypothetical protein